jgi:F0F1-type ATP synthase membrane subunit a
MFLLAEEGGHHEPIVVEFINHYLGEPIHHFQLRYTKPIWESILKPFGTTPEALFGAYTPENAIPWYTVMFVIACILTMVVIWILKGKISEDDPTPGQLTLEAGFLALREMAVNVIGEHGLKYFPVVATFAVLILVANLMDFPALFAADGAHLCYARARFNFFYLLQLRRNKRKRSFRASGAFCRTAAAFTDGARYHAADFLY